MHNITHVKHIWTTVAELAADLDVPYTTAHSWDARGRIPADYDLVLVERARQRGFALTLEQLAEARLKDTLATHNASSVTAANPRQGRIAIPAQKAKSEGAR